MELPGCPGWHNRGFGITNTRAFEIVMELAQQAVADPHEDPDEAKMQDEAIELVASLRTYAQELDATTGDVPTDVTRAILAEAHSDDVIVEVTFDASGYFAIAPAEAICKLARNDWGRCYEADAVAQHFAQYNEGLSRLFEYLEILKTISPQKRMLVSSVPSILTPQSHGARLMRPDVLAQIETGHKPMSMYRCPQCKGIDLEVAVTCWPFLLQDGPDAFETDTDSPDDGSHEFDGKSSAKCNGCSHTAKLDKFESPDWARCSGSDANGVECPEILEQGEDYFSSPCAACCQRTWLNTPKPARSARRNSICHLAKRKKRRNHHAEN